ncbi:MAG TPA: hypothetical protein VFW40_12570 [Capsulimonadaceae bacterium]|nr:hypothetical protein [Capsulimonadaceae bacterium]
MTISPAYPTRAHADAADAISAYFSKLPACETVLLTNSCARGKASPDSCLDITVLVRRETPGVVRTRLNENWEAFYASELVFEKLKAAGRFSEVHLDITDGKFVPEERNWTGGPDHFELEIGNVFIYSAPLWERGEYYQVEKARWLPYYRDDLRKSRLAMVEMYCINNLDHIPLYLKRGLYFQSFNRLYDAYREFLQALFISRRTYPIAYDKWIREQIEEILDLPGLYKQLPALFEVHHFESDEIGEKAQMLRGLVQEWIVE